AERTQRAVGGLRAGIDLDIRAHPGVPLGRGAVVRSVSASKDRLVGAAALAVPEVVGSDIAADADTSIGARDIIEPVTVQAADLHVFDRFGLNWKISGLRPGHGDHSRRGAEE